MIHHGRIWQDTLLGEEVAKQFAAVKTRGGWKGWGEEVGALITNTPNETKREEYIPPYLRPSLHPSVLGCLVSWCVDMDV